MPALCCLRTRYFPWSNAIYTYTWALWSYCWDGWGLGQWLGVQGIIGSETSSASHMTMLQLSLNGQGSWYWISYDLVRLPCRGWHVWQCLTGIYEMEKGRMDWCCSLTTLLIGICLGFHNKVSTLSIHSLLPADCLDHSLTLSYIPVTMASSSVLISTWLYCWACMDYCMIGLIWTSLSTYILLHTYYSMHTSHNLYKRGNRI